jgi:hypothetical protein
MNTVPTVKLVVLLSGLALASLAAFVLGVALDTRPLVLFNFAVGALVLLVVAGDYAPRPPRQHPRPADIVPFAPLPAPMEAPSRLAA